MRIRGIKPFDFFKFRNVFIFSAATSYTNVDVILRLIDLRYRFHAFVK